MSGLLSQAKSVFASIYDAVEDAKSDPINFPALWLDIPEDTAWDIFLKNFSGHWQVSPRFDCKPERRFRVVPSDIKGKFRIVLYRGCYFLGYCQYQCSAFSTESADDLIVDLGLAQVEYLKRVLSVYNGYTQFF
jgi:hypothetical protein